MAWKFDKPEWGNIEHKEKGYAYAIIDHGEQTVKINWPAIGAKNIDDARKFAQDILDLCAEMEEKTKD